MEVDGGGVGTEEPVDGAEGPPPSPSITNSNFPSGAVSAFSVNVAPTSSGVRLATKNRNRPASSIYRPPPASTATRASIVPSVGNAGTSGAVLPVGVGTGVFVAAIAITVVYPNSGDGTTTAYCWTPANRTPG